MAQRKQRPVQDVCRRTVIDMGAVAEKIDLEGRQLSDPGAAARGCRMARPDEEASVEAASSDGVRRAKRPIREERLHDFKTVGDPVDAMDDRQRVHAGLGLGRKAQHDLWLDPGFGQPVQRNRKRLTCKIVDGAIVDIAPDRRIRQPYSAQMVRLVKPILRPIGRSPRASLFARTAGATR